MATGLAIAALLVSLLTAAAAAAEAVYSRRQMTEERELRQKQLAALAVEVAVKPSVRASTVSFSDDGTEVTVAVYVTNIGGSSEAYWEAALIEPADGRQVGDRVRGPAPLVPNIEHAVVFRFPRAEVPPDTEHLSVAFQWGSSRVLPVRRSRHRIQYGRAWLRWQTAHAPGVPNRPRVEPELP